MSTIITLPGAPPRTVTQELASIRKQLELLQESLLALYNLPPGSPWPEILSRFQILNLRYEQVQDEISRSSLKDYVAIPKGFELEDPEFTARVLLRTKLIPEIEEEQEQIRKRAKLEFETRYGDADPEKLLEQHDTTISSALAFLKQFSRNDDKGDEYRADLTDRFELPQELARGKLERNVAKRELEAVLRFQSSGIK